MVFTHLPSNFLLLFVPLMPTMELAVAMLLIRHLLSQMDVPTPSRTPWLSLTLRKEPRLRAFVRGPQHRRGDRAFIYRSDTRRAGTRLPFLIAGGMKIVYDV